MLQEHLAQDQELEAEAQGALGGTAGYHLKGVGGWREIFLLVYPLNAQVQAEPDHLRGRQRTTSHPLLFSMVYTNRKLEPAASGLKPGHSVLPCGCPMRRDYCGMKACLRAGYIYLRPSSSPCRPLFSLLTQHLQELEQGCWSHIQGFVPICPSEGETLPGVCSGPLRLCCTWQWLSLGTDGESRDGASWCRVIQTEPSPSSSRPA